MARELDRIAVYGRTEGTAIFELIALAEDGAPPEWAAVYDEALARYRARDFGRAIERFQAVIEMRGADMAAKLMLERSRGFLRQAPPGDWAGTTVLGMK